MVDEVKTDTPRRIESPTVAPESQPILYPPEEAKGILSEHLRLMLEKADVPWGTTLAWSEGSVAGIPSYEGHIRHYSDKNGEIDAMVISLMRGKGFTGEPVEKGCSWTRHYTRLSPDAYIHEGEGGKVTFETVKSEDRQTITYTGEMPAGYKIYGSEAMPGVWFIRAAYNEEKISGGYDEKTQQDLIKKAKEQGFKKPEPSKPRVVWQIYRVSQMPKATESEAGYVAAQRQEGVPGKPNKTEVPLLSPGSGWSRKTESSAAGTFGGGRGKL
jgi:hypothetical protein